MLTFILKQKLKNKQKPVGMFSLLPLPGSFLSSFLFSLKTRPQILTFLSKCICHFLDTAQVYLLPFQLISLSAVSSSAGHLLPGGFVPWMYCCFHKPNYQLWVPRNSWYSGAEVYHLSCLDRFSGTESVFSASRKSLWYSKVTTLLSEYYEY